MIVVLISFRPTLFLIVLEFLVRLRTPRQDRYRVSCADLKTLLSVAMTTGPVRIITNAAIVARCWIKPNASL
jgi:hypothetical protein